MRSSTCLLAALSLSSVIGFQTSPFLTKGPLQRSSTGRNAFIIDSATGSALDAFFEAQPYLAAFLTCSVKASSADLLAQLKSKAEEHFDGIDVSRNLAFLTYGGIWQGMFQQFVFSSVYPAWFGSDHSLVSVALQVAFDTMVFGPMICLPIVYSVKSLFTSGDFSFESVQKGLSKYFDDVMNKDLLKTYWTIWIPAQSLTFGVVPPHLRVLFVAAVSFCWICVLSSVSSENDHHDGSKQAFSQRRPAFVPVPVHQHQ